MLIMLNDMLEHKKTQHWFIDHVESQILFKAFMLDEFKIDSYKLLRLLWL